MRLKWTLITLSLAALPLLATACTTSSASDSDADATDSQGQLLSPCDSDSACRSDLSCFCGVCTRTCDSDDACEGGDREGVCSTGDGAACGDGAAPEGDVCLPMCEEPPGRPDCEGAEPVLDANGCVEGYECPMNGCPVVMAPECRDGELVSTTGPDGCTELRCEITDCPPVANPVCEPGEMVVERAGADGCPQLFCEPNNGCPPIAEPICEDFERVVFTTDESGCSFGECVNVEGCDDAPEPEIGFCGDEQSTDPVLDDNGCIERWECNDAVCDEPTIPECEDGQEPERVEDSAGCFSYFCPNDDMCPDVANPVCEPGEMVVERVGDDGCPQLFCEPNHGCPPIAEPICEDNERLVSSTDAEGCPQLDCVNVEGCDDAPEPEIGFCGDEQSTDPVLNDNGCIERWECNDAVCDEPTIPECEDGQEPERVEDSAGCISYFCPAGGPTFSCGAQTCDTNTEYCTAVVPGVPDGEISYSCGALPEVCLPEPDCACLETSGGDCRQDDTGAITVTYYAP